MARNVAYYIDAEEEERKRRQVEEAFGPPPPPPNLGVMSKGQIAAADIEAAKARSLAPAVSGDSTDWDRVPEPEDSDEDLASALDAIAEDPESYSPLSPEEMARAVAWKKAHGQPVPAGVEQQAPVAGQKPGESPLDVFLEPGVIDKVGERAVSQRLPLEEAQKRAIRQGTDLSIFDTTSKAANPFEEEAQARAAEQKQSAPAAVDKQAASVADAQKGVPAANTPPPIGRRTDAMVAEMKNEAPAATSNYTDASRFYKEPAKGDGFLGVGDLPNFRDERIRRVQELYGNEEAPSRQWEDEFLRGRERLTDAQIRRRSAVMGVFGDPHQGEHWAEGQRRANAGYDEGLEKARAHDAGNRRIPQGLAEAIAATGQVSPEAAVKLRMNDPLVKNFGQYAGQGGRYEGQQVGLRKNENDKQTALRLAELGYNGQQIRAMLNAGTQLDLAESRGQPALPTQDQIDFAAGLMGQTFGVGKAEGLRILQGDTSKLTPEQARQAENLAPQILYAARTGKGLPSIVSTSVNTQATKPMQIEMDISKAVSIAQQNPKTRYEIKTEWTDATIALNNAYNAWGSLSQDDQDRFAQWASGGFAGTLKDTLSTVYGDKPPAELLTKYAQVQRYVNAIVKRLGGSAVTGSEWGRIADELGIARDDWSPFKSGSAITQHMIDSAKALTAHHDVFVNEFKDWESLNGGR